MQVFTFPHGVMFTATLLLSLMAAQVVTDVANASCQVLYSNKLQTSVGFIGFFSPNSIDQVNYWRYCTKYSSVNLSDTGGALRFSARVFALIAACISFVVTLASWSLCCWGWNTHLYRIAGLALLIAALAQGLSFLIASSSLCDQGCSMTWAGGLSMVACVMFVGLALVLVQVKGSEKSRADKDIDEGTEKMNDAPVIAEGEHAMDTV